MKVRAANALKEKDITSSRYEVVKVLGKGSFGVVRLVREKVENKYVARMGTLVPPLIKNKVLCLSLRRDAKFTL